jgi:hypothetical protein
MKFPPTLTFYGNHSIDFENDNPDALKYYVISELRKIPIPDEIFLEAHNSLIKQFGSDQDLSTFWEFDTWYPVSFPILPQLDDVIKKNIALFGPMGLNTVFTPHHIMLPAVVYEPLAWYCPQNRELVQTIRSYYHAIINHFGGDHALYVNERIADKYYSNNQLVNGSALTAFEQTLVSRYGPVKKPMYSFTPQKLPKYYLDPVTDTRD